MFTHMDATYARMRYEEILREAEEQRRFAQVAAQNPGLLQSVFAALMRFFASRRAQQGDAQAPVMRQGLAAE